MNKFLTVFGIIFGSYYVFALGGLPGDNEKEQVKAAITSHSNEMRICYNENQKAIRGAEGKMYIQYEVNDQGALVKTEMDTKKSTFKNETLFKCVIEKAKTWFFPAAPKGTTVVVLHPFTFKKIRE